MKHLIIFIGLMISTTQLFACLNGASLELKDGTFLYEDHEGFIPRGHNFFYSDFDEGIRRMDSLYELTNDIDYLSDKGLIWILQEKYEEAIALYHQIEKISPNRYATAANIGTAYELIGNDKKALKYIEKAVRLNPHSHEHSEWIHVNILKAKIKGEAFHTTDFLLNTNFGDEEEPKTNLSRKELKDLRHALYFQLNERVSFVKPKDKIVAQLLFDLGNISILLGQCGDAKEDFALAKKYGFNQPIIEQRIEACNITEKAKRIAKKSISESSEIIGAEANTNALILGIIAVILGLFGLIYFVRSRQS